MHRTTRRKSDQPQTAYDRLEPRILFATQLDFNVADPAGSRVYRANGLDAIDSVGETDEYLVTVAAGQRLSARVVPIGNGLQPRVTILSDDGSIVFTSNAATAPGQSAIVQPVALPGAGTYRIEVVEENATTGDYRIEAFLNSNIEAESVGATTNDTLVGAVNLNGQTTLLQGSGRLAAVAGTADGQGKRDLYRIDLSAGEAFSALLDREGDGFGQFAFENTFEIVSSYNHAVATGDFNNDGFDDVVAGGESGSQDGLRVLLSDGQGGLSSVGWGTPNTIYDLAVGDFDEDGDLDIATISLSGSYPYSGTGESTRLTIYFGDGSGGADWSYDRYLFGSGYTIATGDLNGDDHADLVVGIVNEQIFAESGSPAQSDPLGTVAIFLGDGGGNFDGGKYYSAIGAVYDVAVVDLNNDGNADIIAGQGDPEAGTGWISRYVMSSFDPGSVAYVAHDAYDDEIIRVAAGDFNGSGGGDYLGLHRFSNNVSVTLTDANGEPSVGYGFQPSGDFGNQSAVVLADVNRDGFVDVLTTVGGYGSQNDVIHVSLNDGGGFFFAGTSQFDKMGENVGPFGVADLNGDGDVDLIGLSSTVSYDEDIEDNVVEVSTRLGLGEVNFELLDAAGNRLLLPGSGGFNAYRGILDYISPAGGALYLSVTGDPGQQYQLALTGGAKFGLDPELIDNRPQDMTLAGQVASRVQYGGETDTYTVSLVNGDAITVNVVARNLGSNAPGGNLVPRVELLDPNGNVVASDLNPTNATTATFGYNATSTGIYKVRITSKTGAGDYDVTVTGHTGATTPFVVQSTSPASGATVDYRPWVGITFSQPVLIGSIQGSDVLVNGQPAAGFFASDAYQIFFDTDELFQPDGTYTVTVVGGSVLSAFGTAIAETTFSFTVDAVGPQVTSSTIQQNQTVAPGPLAWNATFDEELVTIISVGMFGQLILDTSDVQTTNLSSGASVPLSQMQFVANGPGGDPVELGFAYSNLLEGRYEARLKSGSYSSPSGGGIGFVGRGPNGSFQALDGEFDGTFPSGDGNSGGDFVLNFNVDAPGITQLTSLTAMPPVGSIVHELSTVRAFHETGDVDSFSINLDSNQQITVMLIPQGGSPTAKLDLRDPSGALLGTASGSAGQTVVLQSVNGTTGGLYRIDATSLAGFSGYTLRVIINAAAESELSGAVNNNTRATAQPLSLRQIVGGFPGARSAVVGDATGSEDFYRIDLVAGQPASFALSGVEGGVVSFRIENSAGTILTYGAGGQGNADQTAIDFIPNVSGAYYVVVTGAGRYNLLATRNASFERELTPAPDPAQDLSVTHQIVGHLKGGTPAAGEIDVLQVAPNSASVGGDLNRLINQLNDDSYFNFNATRTTVGGADTIEELAPYDVVILTQLASSQYTPGLASALKKYVELGGAVIVSGSVTQTFAGSTISPFAQLLPFTPSAGGSSVGGALAAAIAHPITNLYSPTSFPVSVYYPNAVVSGATVVGINGTRPTLIVRENIGFGGRTIYLGPEYGDQFNSTTLRGGHPDRLLEQTVAWAAGAGDQSDAYSLSLNAGDSITLTTGTPNSETALPENLLDPVLELYNPAGQLVASNDNGPDGRNSRINYTATVSGAFRVVVRAKDVDGGAYTLQVTGATGSSLVVGPKVVSTIPDTAPLSAAPAFIDVVLSENILASSVQPADLTIVGGTVTGANLTDGRTVRFTINVADVDTTYSYSVPAGAFTDLQGDTSAAFTSTFNIDKLGPYVVSSNPASQASSPFTLWSFTFSETLTPLPSSYSFFNYFDITKPDGSPLESFRVRGVSIVGNVFSIEFYGLIDPGTYTVALKPAAFTDVRGNYMDQDRDGSGAEALDDRYVSSITLASPNLVVDSVEVLGTPVFGSPVTVRWTVRNAGTDPATDGWQDRLYLSPDTSIDGSDLILLTLGTPTVPLAPGQTYTRTETVNLPLNTTVSPGNYRFIVWTDRANTQQESNENDNVTPSPATPVGLPALPDLGVTNVQVTPATPTSGGQATVRWTLTNNGTAAVTGVIRDRVLLSSDATAGGDTSIGEFDYFVSLTPGQSVTRSALVTIPINQFGQRWFVVSTDVNNVVFEHVQESNNTALTASPVNITLAPVPDLQVTAITSPANVTSGTSPTISWTLTNNGSADFSGSISENIYLSSDAAIGGDEYFKTVTFTGTIPAGQSITRTTTLDIPIGYAGQRHVVITTDAANSVFEDLGESNNTSIDDQPMLITIPPTPDLVVTSITAPATAASGRSMTVQWELTNNGTAAASGPFSETIYLSSDATIGNDQSFGVFTFNGTLAPGQTVIRTQTIQLPNVYQGTFRVVVATDSNNRVFENTQEGNNTTIDDATVTIIQSPFPNLVVDSVTAPPTAGSEETIEVDWVVTNTGGASTSALGWSDRIYVSADNIFGAGDVLLATVANASFLDAGDSYAQTASVTLPKGLQGEYYIFVVTDVFNQVFEYAPSASAENDNRNVSGVINITLTPPPDLVVSSIAAPLVAFSGSIASVSWTVTNGGVGSTRPSEVSWLDEVWLSTDTTIDGNDTFLGFFNRTGGLAPGASYSNTASVRLPTGISGDYYFIVRTDSTDRVFEDAFEANNTTAETTTTEVLLSPPADLRVSALTIPASGTVGRSIPISYAVVNEGASGTPVSSWTDRIYLSPTPTLESSTAILISTRTQTAALAASAGYERTVSAVVPLGTPAGNYYVFVAADSQNQVFELDNANNIVGSVGQISITEQFADLQIEAFTSPAVAEAGTGALFSWTILNAGTGNTIVNRWNDRLVLSGDNVLGNGDDLTLTNLQRDGLLNAGERYVVSRSIAIPQTVVAGEYNLFLVADSGNAVFESNEPNNSNALAPLAITITRQTPDLQVTSVVAPAAAASRQSINIGFTVQNLGSAATQATSWVDEIWLSLDDTIGSDDVRLAQIQRSGSLAINESYTVNRTVTLPDVVGDYRIVVRTDRSNQVVEGPLENNNDRASGTLAIGQSVEPDLAVSNVTAPATAFSGQPATVNYTVTNNGAGIPASPYWYDTVYLSQDAALDSGDRAVGSFFRSGPLDAGDSYAASRTVDVPPGLSGEYFFIVRTDSSDRIFERVDENNIASAAATTLSLLPPVDLVAGTIVLPINGTPGQNASITYTVSNNSTQPALGRWTDSLYLSTDPVWDINDKLFARYEKTGPVNAGDSYSPTVTAPLPGVTPGEYYLIVRSDILNQIAESDENNNLKASLDSFSFDVPALTLDVPSAGTIAQNQGVYYRINVPAGETLLIDFDAAASNGSTQLFVKHGDVPTRSTFDYGYTDALAADQKIVVPVTEAGTYYILAYGDSLSAPTAYSIEARILQFDVIDTNYGVGGNGGKLTLQINGAKFDRTITPTLVSPGGSERAASRVFYTSANRLYATFDLAGLTPNAYDVKLTKSTGESVAVADGLQVVAAQPAQAKPVIFSPSNTGAGALFQFTVSWGNDGINDVPAPLITVAADRPIGQHPDFVDAPGYTFIGVPQDDGPAGIIRPDKTSQRKFYVRNGPRGTGVTLFADRLLDDVNAPYPWDDQRAFFVDPGFTDSEFEETFRQMVADIGPTWGDFLGALADSASLIPASIGFNYLDTSVLQINFLRAAAKVSTSITGRVFASDISVPIADRLVTATNTSTGENFSTYSWNDGTFILDHLAPGTYSLSYGGGIVVAGERFTVSTNQHLSGHVLTVEKGATVRGTVRGPGNVPLEGAAVSIVNSDNVVVSQVLTGTGGAYSLLGLGEGDYTVFVDSAGLARQSSSFNLSATADFVANLTMVAQSRVLGTVVSPVGPNTRTSIILERLPRSDSPAEQFTPIKVGTSFDFSGLPAGDYKITVNRQGYLGTSTNFTLNPQQTLNLGALALGQAASVSGTVSSTSASIPVTGQLVSVYDGETAVGSAQIDTDGTFTILGLPAGSYIVKVPVNQGYSDEIPITLATGQQVGNVNITLSPGGEISGTVTSQLTGQPLAGVVVTLADSLGELRNTATDGFGNYSFARLAPGTYTLRGFGVNQPVAISSLSAPPIDVDLTYVVVGTASGRLTDSSGNAVRGSVRVYRDGNLVGSVFSTVAGRYQVDFAAAGTYVLQPESTVASFNASTVAIAGGTNLTQNFVGGTRSVVVNVPGAPSGATIRLERTTALGKVDVGSVFLQSSGSYTFENLVDGTYQLRVTSPVGSGYAQTLTVSGSDVTVNASLVVEGSLAGVISGPGGVPLAGARVALVSPGDGNGHVAVTRTDGSYSMVNIPAGTYTLVVYASGMSTVVTPAFAVSTSTTHNAQLAAGDGRVSGRLVDGSGVPIAGGHVALVSADGLITYGTAVISSDGTFELAGPTGINLTLKVTSRGVVPVQLAGLNINGGAPVVLGDVSTTALFHGSDGNPTSVGGSFAGLVGEYRGLGAASGQSVPGFLTALERSLATLSRLGNHVTSDQVLPIDDCLKCLEARVRLLNAITLQDRWYELYEEAQDILQRNVLEAIAAFSIDFARNAGIIPKLILTFEGLAAYAATLGPAIVATEVPAGVSALGLGTFGTGYTLAYAIAQMGEAAVNLSRLFWDTLTATDASDASAKLAAANTAAINLNQLITNVLGTFFSSVGAGAAGALGDIYAFIIGGEDLMAQLRFQLLQDVLRDLAGSQARYENAQTQYAKSVNRAFSAMKAYNRCLANAKNKECDPDDPVYDYPPDWLRFIPVFTSLDPNDILGPAGFGPQKYVPASVPLDYTIRFENDPTAEAPAQVVTITQTLDSDLDARTFRLGDFGFSGEFFDVPADSSFYQTRLDLRETRGIYLDVVAGVDLINNRAFWRFISVDPATGDVPSNPLLGFLPVNTTSPEGEGFVQYTIRAKAGAATGDVIDAAASIVFDQNAPIDTPAIFNTLDVFGPSSAVDPLSPVSGQEFVVFWKGDDDAGGSAIATFDIYVSTNGSEYVLWLDDTDLRQATFAGESGKTYSFYSVAVDNTGNVEPLPATPDATTTVGGTVNHPPILDLDEATGAALEGSSFTRVGLATDIDSGDVLTAEVDYGTGAGFVPLALDASGNFTLHNTYADNDVYTVVVRVTDSNLASVTRQFNVTVSNVAPTVATIENQVVAWDGTGGTFTVGGSFIDPGTDTFVGEVDYGSGFVPLTLNPDGTFALSNRFTTPGLYTVTVRVTDDDTGVGEESFTVRLLPPPPSVASVQVNDGNAQRSMVKSLQVTFDHAVVGFPASAVSIRLRTPTGPAAVAANMIVAQTDTEGKVWTITFTGAGLEGESLADGYYDVTIDQSQLADTFAQTGSGTAQANFHRLFGDADGDRDTDARDLNAVRASLGRPASYVWFLDAESDGDVDNNDFTAARLRMNKQLFV